jgi:glutamate/tyrosine decarboxylase-like PLP-dependent enzyme
MAVVCFRFCPAELKGRESEEELNELNRRLVEEVNRTGEAYLTHTSLKGLISMRLAVGNVLTTERHLARVLELIRRQARALLGNPLIRDSCKPPAGL